MPNWTGRLRKLMSTPKPEPPEPAADLVSDEEGMDSEGWEYINHVRDKLSALVDDFAQGRVNRAQFEELYAHYQEERESVEKLISLQPSSDAWRMAVTEGESIMIRRRLAARVLGYAVYDNQSQQALRVYGEFGSLNERWIAPLLDRAHSVASEPFIVASLDSGNKSAHLCAVKGVFTTLIVLFTKEPARVQLQLLEDLHRHFEQANHRLLTRALDKIDDLVFPYAVAFE